MTQKSGSKIYVSDGKYQNRNWDNEPAGKEYFNELLRVSKHQIIWGVNYFDYPFAGGRIIWDKCNYGIYNEDTSQCLEEGDNLDRLSYWDNGNKIVLEDVQIKGISKDEITIETDDYEEIIIPIDKIKDWD